MARRGRMARGHSKWQFRAGNRVHRRNSLQSFMMRGGVRL